MVNRNKNPTGFSGSELVQEIECVIYNGGEQNGQLLCEECLPFSHRWATIRKYPTKGSSGFATRYAFRKRAEPKR